MLVFGSFEIHGSRRLLLDSGSPVRLGDRAFDILLALVERAGEVVTQQELIARTWPGLYVEQSNLRVHIAALRRILGDPHTEARYIRNVSGRGYSFIAPVTRREDIPGGARAAGPEEPLTVPGMLARIIGRSRTVEVIASQVRVRHLVTLVGPGGIGKTSVALAAAGQLAADYPRQVCFVDLSVVDAPALTAGALATALGVSALAEDPIGSLVAYLRDIRMLIVLDNCEHVIEGAAQLVERLRRGAPAVDLLLTSREPLLVQDECVHRLDGLDAPAPSPQLTAAQALAYPAVQLFVERVAGNAADFALTDEDARDVARICARLDGLPLAIELAAARVSVLGLQGLACQLDSRLMLLSQGRRTAQPRHRSLRALLDWSYGSLSREEQTLLRRLSVFRAAFSAPSAAEVVAWDDALTQQHVHDGMVLLAGKSLVTAEPGEAEVHYYRLLQTTRTYAFARLEDCPAEHTETLHRHALHLCSVLSHAQSEWDTMPRAQWVARYGRMIDDVRAALDWAFGPQGDAALGAILTAVSLPFGFQLAQIDEFTRRAERALRTLATVQPPQPMAELRLQGALGTLLWNTGGHAARITAAFARAAEIAEEIGTPRLKVEPLTYQAVFQIELGDYPAGVAACEQLAAVAEASADPLARLIAERAAAQAYHFAGDHGRSRTLAEAVLRHPARAIPLAYSQTSVDKAVSMRIVLARIRWLEGFSDQAAQIAAEALELAAADGPFATCQVLALAACPIALWCGDPVAPVRIEELLKLTSRYTLDRWHCLGLCFQSTLSETVPGESGPVSPMQRDLLVTVSARWNDQATLARAQSGAAGWCAPEVLRVAARMQATGEAAPELAGERLMNAMRLARSQNALAWELRAATSLAGLWKETGRTRDARACLEPVLGRFSEGHQTADLRAAALLLLSL